MPFAAAVAVEAQLMGAKLRFKSEVLKAEVKGKTVESIKYRIIYTSVIILLIMGY